MPVLPKLSAEMQNLYDSLMQSARGCENDREKLATDVQYLVSHAMVQNMPGFAGMKAVIQRNDVESRMLEESFRELAYGILRANVQTP